MAAPGFELRRARPDEIDAIVALDDAATTLYAPAGLDVALAPDHPYVVAEIARWTRAIDAGLSRVATAADGRLLGFMTLGYVDEAPYLDQLAVHPDAMRRGIGSALLQQAFDWAGPRPLWLTTYAHLPWNRPWYERHGFRCVSESLCGPQIRRILADQRAALPAPAQRVALVRQRVSSTT